MKQYLIRGKNRILVPLSLIDKSLSYISQGATTQELEKYEKIALNWIRRTVWEELIDRNNCEYNKQVVPLTLNEFKWLKLKYDQPI